MSALAHYADLPLDISRGPRSAKTGREQMQQMTWRAAPLFDHLIGALLQKERHVQAERLGGLDVDDKLELDRGLDRKIGRLFSAQDAVNIGVAARRKLSV